MVNKRPEPEPVRPEGDHNYILKQSSFKRLNVCSKCEGIVVHPHETLCPHCGADSSCFFEAAVLYNTWEYTTRMVDNYNSNIFRKRYHDVAHSAWTYGGWKFIEPCSTAERIKAVTALNHKE